MFCYQHLIVINSTTPSTTLLCLQSTNAVFSSIPACMYVHIDELNTIAVEPVTVTGLLAIIVHNNDFMCISSV